MTNNQPQKSSAVSTGVAGSQTLPVVSDGFINVITGIPSSGLMAKTFICSNMDMAGNTNTYFMKIYSSDKNVINEMVGYMLAKERGLGVASKAYLLEIGVITKTIIDGFYSSNGKVNTGEHNQTKYAFIVSAAPGINMSAYSSDLIEQTEFFKKRIKSWKNNNMLIAFDEWIANTDRNANNIIFGHDDIYVIDHGSSPVKMDWTIGCLVDTDCYNNIHMLNSSRVLGVGKVSDLDLSNESAYHASVFSNVKAQLVDLITNTVSMSADYIKMIDFIENRAINARVSSFSNMSGVR